MSASKGNDPRSFKRKHYPRRKKKRTRHAPPFEELVNPNDLNVNEAFDRLSEENTELVRKLNLSELKCCACCWFGIFILLVFLMKMILHCGDTLCGFMILPCSFFPIVKAHSLKCVSVMTYYARFASFFRKPPPPPK